MKYLKIGAILLLALLVAGCSQNTPVNTTDSGIVATNRTEFLPPEGYPGIEILNPLDGAVLKTTTIGVKVDVTNFRLAGIVNRPNLANEGHLHYFLDEVEKEGSLESFAFTTTPGTHTLRVELRNNDHTPLYPVVQDSATFSVAP